MKAAEVTLGRVFANYQQNVIPIFQRPYVWKQESNWEPLWSDVRLAAEEQETHTPHTESRTYFLGAIVLQDRPGSPKQLQLMNVIDGQQRLTTLQILLTSARDVCYEIGLKVLAAKFQSLILNPSDIVDQDFPNDEFKVWPLPQDRDAFVWCVDPSRYDACPKPSSQLVHAKTWFSQELRDWLQESDDPETRLAVLHNTLRNQMQLVQIELEPIDDPQVIFEVLNHRGTPLQASDLVKNLLFQQFEHSGQTKQAEELLQSTWLPLDDAPWRNEITTGRVKRLQLDVLLSYWLAMQSTEIVSTEHLFADFKSWLLRTGPNPEDVIKSIRRAADGMLELRALPVSHPVGRLLDAMEAMQHSTPWPLILYMHLTAGISEQDKKLVASAVESFLMRREVTRLGSKDYNRYFLSLLHSGKQKAPEEFARTVVGAMIDNEADTRIWPSDELFAERLQAPNIFHLLTRARLRALLVGMENTLRTSMTEALPLSANDRSLTIEHVLPQKWEKHWPLSVELGDSDYPAVYANRTGSIHSLGNLTLLTSKLNPSLSNREWERKKNLIQKHSVLLLSQGSLLTAPRGSDMSSDEWASEWNENRIAVRSRFLIETAIQAWVSPERAALEFADGESRH